MTKVTHAVNGFDLDGFGRCVFDKEAVKIYHLFVMIAF